MPSLEYDDADQMSITIKVSAEAAPELRKILIEAHALSRRYAENYRLRSQDPTSRRHIWFEVGAALKNAANELFKEG